MLFGHGEAAAVGQGGRRVLCAAGDGYPEIVVDADSEAGIRGAAVFAGRAICRGPRVRFELASTR